MIKRKIREAMAWGYHASKHFLSRLQGQVVILTYHRVLSKKELSDQFVQPGMYVRDDVFDAQMRFLREHFQILPFSELLSLWRNNLWDKRTRYCVVTFDDGWLDNYIHAFPILKRYAMPATIFLPTAYVGTNEWFWPDKIGYLLMEMRKRGMLETWSFWERRCPEFSFPISASPAIIDQVIEFCKTLPQTEVQDLIDSLMELVGGRPFEERMVMSWDEVREMSASGITFGSHSVYHSILTTLSAEQTTSEVADSWRHLQKPGVAALPVFCYPNGGYNGEVADIVQHVGYQAAVTVRSGWESDKPRSLFELRRMGVHNDITSTIPLFSWHLAGWNSRAH